MYFTIIKSFNKRITVPQKGWEHVDIYRFVIMPTTVMTRKEPYLSLRQTKG